MSYISNLYPLSASEHKLTPNKPLTLNVTNEGVPQDAYEVIVYAKISTGYNPSKDQEGELVLGVSIPNGLIERKLLCHIYEQGSWSYNSENIALPVGPGIAREIVAEVKVTGAYGAVQIVGYRK